MLDLRLKTYEEFIDTGWKAMILTDGEKLLLLTDKNGHCSYFYKEMRELEAQLTYAQINQVNRFESFEAFDFTWTSSMFTVYEREKDVCAANLGAFLDLL